MRVTLIVWVKTALTWYNMLNFTLCNYFRRAAASGGISAELATDPEHVVELKPMSRSDLEKEVIKVIIV